MVPIPNGRGRHRAAPFGVGPWDGARVASPAGPYPPPRPTALSHRGHAPGIARSRRRRDGRRLAPVVRSGPLTAARDPSRWGQLGCVLGCVCLRRQGPGAAARRCEWSGPRGEEFAPDISASAGPARRSRPRMAGPVAREGMCRERSPLPRTIATSRGDGNRDGPRDSKPGDGRRWDRTDETGQAVAHGDTAAPNPEEKPFQLDKPFQERTHRPRYVELTSARPRLVFIVGKS